MKITERHEKWILGILIASQACAGLSIGFSFGDGRVGGNSIWTIPAAAFLTLILQSTTFGLWPYTAKKRQGTMKPSFLYSATLCTLTCLLAVFWLAACILAFLLTGVYASDSYTWDRPSGVAWVAAVFSFLSMALMWTEFGMIVHYRKRFLKMRRQALIKAATAAGGPFPSMPQPSSPMYPPVQRQQEGQLPDYLTNTKLERHTKWLLALIIISMVFCLLEFGLSLGDGALGGFSLWMAPVGALLTETLHVVTLPVWKHTAKKRKGTPKPSFIYSVTLCVLTCLLAVYWLTVSILTFCLSGSYYYAYSSGSYYYPYNDIVVPWIEATFALLLSSLMWAQFGIVVHFRHRFLRRVKRAKQAGQLPGTFLVAPAYPMPYGAAQYNPALFQQQQPPLPYPAQYQQQPYHQPPPLPAYQSFQTYPPPTGAPSVVNPTIVEKMGDSK